WLQLKLDRVSGMYRIRGELSPEAGAKIRRAIEREAAAHHQRIADAVKAGTMTQAEADSYSRGRLHAEALATLVGAGHADVRPSTPDLIVTVRAQDLVRVDGGGLCETPDGTLLPVEVARR